VAYDGGFFSDVSGVSRSNGLMTARIPYGLIGLRHLLFRLVHGDRRSTKKTKQRDGRYSPQ